MRVLLQKGTLQLKSACFIPAIRSGMRMPFFLLLLWFCCTGCIGLAVAHPRTKTAEVFSLGNRGVVSNRPSATVLTASNVLAHWGAPDATRTNEHGLTVWQYRGDQTYTFIGLAYMILVPIPIPCGNNQIEIQFKDGSAQRLRRSVDVVTGFMMGIIPPFVVMAWEMEIPDKHPNGVYVGYGFEKLKMPPDVAP
ncbi:MAG: hypothetical protein ACOYOU_03135 [Kiritimatiellia bacterium]